MLEVAAAGGDFRGEETIYVCLLPEGTLATRPCGVWVGGGWGIVFMLLFRNPVVEFLITHYSVR